MPVQLGSNPRTDTVTVIVSKGNPAGSNVIFFSDCPLSIFPELVNHSYDASPSNGSSTGSPFTLAVKVIGFPFSTSLGHSTVIVGQGGGGGSQLPQSAIVTVRVASARGPLLFLTETVAVYSPFAASLRFQITCAPSPSIFPAVTL